MFQPAIFYFYTKKSIQSDYLNSAPELTQPE